MLLRNYVISSLMSKLKINNQINVVIENKKYPQSNGIE